MRIGKYVLSLHMPVAHPVLSAICNMGMILMCALLCLYSPDVAWAARQAQGEALPAEAEAKAGAVCAKTSVFNCYTNNKYGYQVAWPHKLLTDQGESDAGDGQVFSAALGQAQLKCWGEFTNVLPQSLKKEFEARSKNRICKSHTSTREKISLWFQIVRTV